VLAHGSRQPRSWLIFDVGQEMIRTFQLLTSLLIVSLLLGCTMIYDVSDKYRDVVGHQFATRSDCYLNRQASHQYDVEPYRLDHTKRDDNLSKSIAFIPAGTVLTVIAAKRSNIGGDWDLLIAELELPNTGKKIRFEELLGFSSFDPSEVDKRWKRKS
jgi:hypothetical protein